MDLQQLVLRIGGDSKGAESALGNVGTATNKLGGIIKTIIAGAAVAAMVKWTEVTINLGIEAEKAAALLDATMKHTLNSTNEQVAACKSWAENQEKVNHFDAEELMAQLDKGIVKYGDLGTAQVAVSAAQEVARLKGIDVASAYSLVEQASNGMARSLKQFGIEAKAGTSQLGYLQQILDKTSGSTEAYNKTTAGMIGAMKQSYEVMRETLGQALLPLVNTLMTQLSPIIENLTQYIINNMPQIQSAIAKACDGIGEAFKVAGEVIRLVANDINWIIANAGIAINWINKTRVANETRAATNASAGEDFNLTGMLTPNPGTNSVGTLLNIAGGRGTTNRGVVGSLSDVAAGIVKVKDAYAGAGVAAVDSGIAATKASTAGASAAKTASTAIADAAKAAAQKVADTAKATAEAIKQARQAISDKIYTLTHTDQQNEQRALDVEYAANLVASKDKLASKTLYTNECNALLKKYADLAKTKEEEQTSKVQAELDKRLAAQQRYNDAVASATQSLMDQIFNATHNEQQKEAMDIAQQAATSLASGVAPSLINKYVSTMSNGMQSNAGPETLSEASAAVGQYLSGPLKKLNDGIVTLTAAVTQVAPGVGSVINGMGRGSYTP